MADAPPDPPAPGSDGTCLDCRTPLLFHAASRGFRCARCGRLYRGASEWNVSAPTPMGHSGFAPPLSGEPRPPEEPAGFPLIPDYKWVGKKKRKR